MVQTEANRAIPERGRSETTGKEEAHAMRKTERNGSRKRREGRTDGGKRQKTQSPEKKRNMRAADS